MVAPPPPNPGGGGCGALDDGDEVEEVERVSRATDLNVSGDAWEAPLLRRSSLGGGGGRGPAVEGLYVYNSKFTLVPRAVGGFAGLRTLKFFANDSFVLPLELAGLTGLGKSVSKVSDSRQHGFPLENLRGLKGLELYRVPRRSSTFTISSDIAGVKCLTKLIVRHFSIRFLPPEIGCLKKLEELDLSFNKLKNLPNAISGLISLKLLKVTNNELINLPIGLSNLQTLEDLDLSNNMLTSLVALNFATMPAMRYLNLQCNKFLYDCNIPSWICCNLEGCGLSASNVDVSLINVERHDASINWLAGRHSSHGYRHDSSSLLSEASCSGRSSTAPRKPKAWKSYDSLQQKARQERLNYSRNCRGQCYDVDQCIYMDGDDCACRNLVTQDEDTELPCVVNEEKNPDCSRNLSPLLGKRSNIVGYCKFESFDQDKGRNYHGSVNNTDDSSESDCRNELSCITSESPVSDKEFDSESEVDSISSTFHQAILSQKCSIGSCGGASRIHLASKRNHDWDLYNPKPRKCRRSLNGCSDISFKYSSESFCSISDHLPDGFYDAGRDRPFLPLQTFRGHQCLDSREVILLDRGQDEELDAIVLSAQILLSRLKSFGSSTDRRECAVNDFQRASMLALFVSDIFGGSDRTTSVARIRRAVVAANKLQPFICTCPSLNKNESIETGSHMSGFAGRFCFTDLCDASVRVIKEVHNSNVVPLGALRFGVCRHRALLMKYLCDRMNPAIPCELVRGYLDFMPHAWNSVILKQGPSWVHMVVDACYPADIREENDPEYFSRYIPLSRVLLPLMIENSSFMRRSFPSLSLYSEAKNASNNSVKRCKIGTLDAAAKVRELDATEASLEDVKTFEYAFLGEVRMLGALRNHSCIVKIYGHQLSSKWVVGEHDKERRLLQSTIVMEYIKGGSLKNHLEKFRQCGKDHAPIDFAIHVSRDVAWALVEVHSKSIIHRDIKSENILIDLDSNRVDGSPVVKLCDFDRAVPLESSLHSCCIAHVGIHPPCVCVGTPRWMAPEVLQTMNKRSHYGLEVDIWSYGCLLFELLTLRVPYEGLPDNEIYDLLQMKQRPRLTSAIEQLALPNETESTKPHCSDSEKLRLLVELFYKCTSGHPAERPSARELHDELNHILLRSNAAP